LKIPIFNDGAEGKRVRIRRTWYRRRLRTQRVLVAVFVGAVIASACWQNAASYLSSPSSLGQGQGSKPAADSIWAPRNVNKNFAAMAEHPAKRAKRLSVPGVYPYSVVPGGLKDASDLRSAALRDYVIRQHYAHFNFANAELVRATEAREVYLSYRIRNTVFWTRKKVRLHPGELLLTDGKITARTRCGNQISDTAKPEVSDEEPAVDVLDQPVLIADAPPFPARPAFVAQGLPSAAAPPEFFTGGFIFPYAPIGVPLPSGGCPISGEDRIDGVCHKKHKHPKGPPTPEPSTMILISSGLALIGWRYRRAQGPVRA
jgi:hypothetical protein